MRSEVAATAKSSAEGEQATCRLLIGCPSITKQLPLSLSLIILQRAHHFPLHQLPPGQRIVLPWRTPRIHPLPLIKHYITTIINRAGLQSSAGGRVACDVLAILPHKILVQLSSRRSVDLKGRLKVGRKGSAIFRNCFVVSNCRMALVVDRILHFGYGGYGSGRCADRDYNNTCRGVFQSERACFSGDGANKLVPQHPKKLQRRSRKMRFLGLANLYSTGFAITAMASSPTTPPPSVSDYILDSFSGYLLGRGKKLMGPYWPTDRDFLNWLPPELHEQLHKSEAFATFLVRECLVFGTLALAYCQINNFCRWLHRISSTTRRKISSLKLEEDHYDRSVCYAAEAPLRLLISVWAATRLLRIIVRIVNLQHYIGAEVFTKARAIGVVATVTWFFFRWKESLKNNLILNNKVDKTRIIEADRLVSLILYFLAATSTAKIVGFALRSLLAVGGISGLAVGLASKEVVSNVFGGVVIFITRPFVIGERIKAGNVSGQVQDIGYLQTKILGFDGVPLLVPNQAFTSQVITNFSRANSKLLEADFHLHNQDVFLVNKITEDVVAYLQTHQQVETQRSTPMCYLKNMGLWGPEISIMCTINFGGGSFFSIRQEIMVEVARIIVEVLGEDAPYFRNSITNLLWELRMHLLFSGQGLHPEKY